MGYKAENVFLCLMIITMTATWLSYFIPERMPIYPRPKRNTFSEYTKYSGYRVACFCDLMLKKSLEEPHIWMLYIYIYRKWISICWKFLALVFSLLLIGLVSVLVISEVQEIWMLSQCSISTQKSMWMLTLE